MRRSWTGAFCSERASAFDRPGRAVGPGGSGKRPFSRAAFSLFADSTSPNVVRWGLIAFSAIAGLAVLIALVRLGSRISLTTVALALVLGGAIGNLHDRIRYGSVVDFIEVHIFGYHWPDFNVADSCIVIGACLLLLDSLLPSKEAETASVEAHQP